MFRSEFGRGSFPILCVRQKAAACATKPDDSKPLSGIQGECVQFGDCMELEMVRGRVLRRRLTRFSKTYELDCTNSSRVTADRICLPKVKPSQCMLVLAEPVLD